MGIQEGIPSLSKQQILALKYWIRLISLPRSCCLRIVYNSLASLDFIGETNWCSHIRSLLFRTNHRDVWENHRVENANRLIKQVKLCLINTYKVDWSKQQILALKYWIRLISLPRSCCLRIVYNSLASLDFIGETNWCSHIRSLLFRTNHRNVWENHRVENANRLIKQVKLCLINTYKVDWSSKARNSIKLRTYTKIKFDHSLEEYLFYIPDCFIKIKNELTYSRN